MTPNVAVCVPFRARTDHDAQLQRWTEARWRARHPSWAYIVADADSGAPFNQSASRNVAAREAGDVDVLCFANADVALPWPDEMVTAVTSAAERGSWALSSLYVETCESYAADALRSDPGCVMADPLTCYARQLPDSPAGPQVMPREAYEAVNGWDERYTSWGRDDDSMRSALNVLWSQRVRTFRVAHLWHPRTKADGPRNREYPVNKAYYMRNYARAERVRDPEARRVAMRAVVAGNRVQ